MLMQIAASERQKGDELVTLAGAGIRRNRRWLVRGVDLSIHSGEIVTLIGPNGAGKSTTAKMAIGVLRADEGKVNRKTGLTIGYVPQKLAIDWTMPLSVRRLMRLTGRLDDAALMAALTDVGIPHLVDAEVRHLSGGEFQRALLARAIARNPDLLVLDEPVQGVDFAGESALYELIRTIRQKTGCGILLISHDLHMVMADTDTVICLNGHVCCRGTPEAVSRSDDYRRLFGNVGAGLAVYSHHHDHTHLPDGRVQHKDGSVTDHCYPDDGHHDDGHDHHDHHHQGHHHQGHHHHDHSHAHVEETSNNSVHAYDGNPTSHHGHMDVEGGKKSHAHADHAHVSGEGHRHA